MTERQFLIAMSLNVWLVFLLGIFLLQDWPSWWIPVVGATWTVYWLRKTA